MITSVHNERTTTAVAASPRCPVVDDTAFDMGLESAVALAQLGRLAEVDDQAWRRVRHPVAYGTAKAALPHLGADGGIVGTMTGVENPG